MAGTVVSWWMEAKYRNSKIKMSFKTLSWKATCVWKLDGLVITILFLRVKSILLCFALLPWDCAVTWPPIQLDPGLPPKRDARGCLGGRTRKEQQFASLPWEHHLICTSSPRRWQWLTLIPGCSFSNTPRTGFSATSTCQGGVFSEAWSLFEP